MAKPIDRAALLATLLKQKPVTSFTESNLGMKAHWRWDRDQHLEAFVLFDAAAARADEQGVKHSAIAYRNRAAVTLAQSSADPDEATRRLRAVLDYYRRNPTDEMDSHFAEWAATWLLEVLACTDAKQFERHYRAAVADCAACGRADYPYILPQIMQVAELARRAGAREICAELVARRRDRGKIDKKLRARLATLETWSGAKKRG